MSLLSILRFLAVFFVVFSTTAPCVVLAENTIPFSQEADVNITFENENLYETEVPENLERQAHLTYGETKEAQKKAGLPQLDPSWFPSQIFWILTTFALMYGICSRGILPHIATTLENRHEHIQNNLDTAEDLKEQAEEAHRRYDELMSGAYQESRALVQKNDEIMKIKYNEFMEDFQERSVEQLKTLDKELKKIKTQSKADMHDMVADLATQAADKIAGVKADKKDMKTILNSLDKKAA